MTDNENVENLDQNQADSDVQEVENNEEKTDENKEKSKKETEVSTLLENLKKDYDKINENYIRALAEMDNLRKRTKLDIENNAKFAISGFAKDLLAVADNLERALAAVPEEAKEKDESLKNIFMGVEMTSKELAAIFERNGIKRLQTEDKLFDPNFEQAVQEIDDPTRPTGTVVKELQAGYTINGRILREAMVIVSKGGIRPDDANAVGAKVDTSA
ncbi:MAG: nucleotide exchange factor GrpE [Alphaproteobacteria bacterium]